MTIYGLLIWAGFGALIGGFAAFFLRRRGGYDIELAFAGTAGALLGGVVGTAAFPDTSVGQRDWLDAVGFAGALVTATVFVYLDWVLRARPRSHKR